MRTSSQSGNILFFILIGIVLIAALTVALRDSGGLSGSIDKEKNSAMAQKIIAYNNDVAAGVQALLQSGASEADIRFAHPNNDPAYGDITTTPQYQVFSAQGGKVSWQAVPSAALISGQSSYINFGGDRKFTQIGSDRADLYLDAYPLTDEVCLSLNAQLGFTNTTIPVTDCGPSNSNGTFTGIFSDAANNVDMTGLSKLPATQACLKCSNFDRNVYFGILIAR